MFNKTPVNKALSCLFASSLVVPTIAVAQSNNEIETIEVTATKRTQNIQEVPVAVSALSGDAMDALGIDNFQDYVEFLPNVTFQGTGPGQNEIYIRGAATSQTGIAVSSVQALQPSVATYLDEIPVSMQGRNLDVYATDIERVEVLPGPQGTLFGASSQAGTVRIISKKPNHNDVELGFDMNTGFTKGGDLSNSVEGYFNLPITDDLAFRVAAYTDHQGGWIDNVQSVPGEGGYIGSVEHINRISAGQPFVDVSTATIDSPSNSDTVQDNYNDATYAGARFSLSYLINNDWSILFQHTAQSLETEGVFAYDPSYDDQESTSRFEPETNQDTFGLTTWTLEGRLGQLDVVYAGGYLDRQIDTTVDYIGYTNGGFYSAFYACDYGTAGEEHCYDPRGYYGEDTESTRFTQEFRINTPVDNVWRLTAGVYLDEQSLGTVGEFQLGAAGKFTDGFNREVTGEGTNNNGKQFAPEISYVNDVTHDIDQLAVFGNFEYDLTETVTAGIGVRWYTIDDIYTGGTTSGAYGDVTGRIRAFGGSNQDIIDFFGAEEGQKIIDAVANGQLETDLLDSEGVLTVDDTILKFSVNWDAMDNVMFFANYSEGFRPPVTARTGGAEASISASGSVPAGSAFDGYRIPVYSLTDTLENYEVGMKGDFFERSLRFNATAYYSEINDLQTSRFDPTNIAFFVFTDNVGTAEIAGVDADFTWRATDNLIISGAFSLLDSEITELNETMNNISAPVGSALPYTAPFSGNIRARYFYTLDNGWDSYINASISYTGERLSGMFGNAYVTEDTHELVYGTGTGLEIEQEIPKGQYEGVSFNDRNGEAFAGGRYVAQAYSIANLAFGVTNGAWNAELYINNLFDERAELYIDEQQFTPKVVTNRPMTMGVRFGYDF
ncbi:MAG: TonB-dependent receptor [Gammaproteobacteria bacterium]|nr:TonB-dependent receptor [Gammaproteobacteria bacterium]